MIAPPCPSTDQAGALFPPLLLDPQMWREAHTASGFIWTSLPYVPSPQDLPAHSGPCPCHPTLLQGPFSGLFTPHPLQAPGQEQQEEGEGLGLAAPSD